MPTLSVIIPVYNVAPYLRACLDSVCIAVANAQKAFHDFTAEIICVDDGSTDGSGAILDEYAERFNSSNRESECVPGEEECKTTAVHLHLLSPPPPPLVFRIIHQPNAGVSAARNAALDVAMGEWVMMLDSDDTWSSDLIEQLFARINKTPDCDAVGFGMMKVDESGRELGAFGRESVTTITTGDDILYDRGPLAHFLWSSSDKVYRRSVIEQMGLRYTPGLRTSEDSLFAHQFFTQASKVVLAPEIMGYRYLMHEGSAIHTLDRYLPESPFFFFFKMHDLWRKNPSPGLTRRLQFIAAGQPSLGKSENFAPNVRGEAIEYLLRSKDFNRILWFMILHGTNKMRLFAIAYLVSPWFVRRLILKRL